MFKNLVYKKIFVSAYIIFYVLCLPLYSYASTMTYNQFMKLTASGVAKVTPRAATIGLGVWAARGLLGLSGVGLVVTVALGVHDLYNLYKEITMVNVSVPAVVPSPVPQLTTYPTNMASGTYGRWGEEVGPGIDQLVYSYRNADGTSPVVHCDGVTLDLHGATFQLVSSQLTPVDTIVCGGYTAISAWTCGGTVTKASEFVHVYYKPYPVLAPLPAGVPTVNLNEGTSTYPMAGREEIQSQLAEAKKMIENQIAQAPEREVYYRQIYQKIVAAENAFKSVPLEPGDYTKTGVAPAENTFPAGTDPDAISFPPVPPDTTEPPPGDAPPVPNDACSYYQRTKHFDYSSLLQSAQAVPLLGLLSKLVINPAAGQFDGKATFHLSKFGAQEIDLNKWHYSDAIAIFRFVIIGGAFLTAIRIIYD